MPNEHVVMTVTIPPEGLTILQYKDKNGHPQIAADHTLEEIISKLEYVNYTGAVETLTEGKGRRTVSLDIVITDHLRESLGFNEVGEIVLP